MDDGESRSTETSRHQTPVTVPLSSTDGKGDGWGSRPPPPSSRTSPPPYRPSALFPLVAARGRPRLPGPRLLTPVRLRSPFPSSVALYVPLFSLTPGQDIHT